MTESICLSRPFALPVDISEPNFTMLAPKIAELIYARGAWYYNNGEIAAESIDADVVVDYGDRIALSFSLDGVDIDECDIVRINRPNGSRYKVLRAFKEACCGRRWQILAEKLSV